MTWLYGKTGYSFIDCWTVVHLCFWVFAGHIPWVCGWNRLWSMIGCLTFAYMWEVFEHFMAPRHPQTWLSPESWWNSWVSDPLTCVIGVIFIWRLLDVAHGRV